MTREGLLVVTALLWEADAIRASLSGIRCETGEGWFRWDGASGSGRRVSVLAAGIGVDHCRRALAATPNDFTTLVSAGCAGALEPELVPGDMVLGQRVVVSGGGSHPCDPGWLREVAHMARRAGLRAREGAILAASKPLLDADAKARARRQSGALAVEMEASAVAEEAARRGAAFAVTRAILDPATAGLRHAVGCVDSLGRPKARAVIAALAGGRLEAAREFAQLAAGRRACARSLGTLFRELFAAPVEPN